MPVQVVVAGAAVEIIRVAAACDVVVVVAAVDRLVVGIRTKFITPAIEQAGWDLLAQVREEVYFTKGRVIVKGKTVSRGKAKFADYILYLKPHIPIAVIEAKDNNHGVGDGMQQALLYADKTALDLPFVFSSNGDGFLFHDRTGTFGQVEQELALDSFPAPDLLWRHYCQWKGIKQAAELVVAQDYHSDGSGKRTSPQYVHARDDLRSSECR